MIEKQTPDRVRETREQRIERLLSKPPKQLTTAARTFDYREATAIATRLDGTKNGGQQR